MNTDRIFEAVTQSISNLIATDEIERGSELKKDLGLDSLSLVGVIVGLEEKFNIQFDDADLDPSLIITVQNIVSLVEKYL